MTFQPKFQNLVEIYEHATSQFSDLPLFGVKKGGEWVWTTYGDFRNRTDALRATLAEIGIQKGDAVAVISNNRPEWAIGAYAVYGLGASYVPMYEAQSDKEWKYILNDCDAKLVFVATEEIRDRVVGFRSELEKLEHVVVFEGSGDDRSTTFEELVAQGKGKEQPLAELELEDIAGFIYTSGTTGNPKGVLLSHQNLAYNVSAIHEVFPMGCDDRSLSFLPWAHSFGQTLELHGLFSMGASMGIAEAVDKIVDNLAEVQPTLLFSVPRIFNRIYDGLHKRMAEEGGLKKKLFESAMDNEEHRKELADKRRSSGWADLKHKVFDKVVFSKVRQRFGGRLKYAFSGGAAISREVAEFIDNLGIMVYEGYGLTETSPIATANWPGSRRLGSVGKAIPGVRIEIDTSATEDPKQGEIVVYGHNVMQGYHNLPEENEKAFTEDHGFRTGDMGYKDDQGFVYITGRIKEQFKLETGKYVAPSPLEEHLKLSPHISNVMIYGDNKPYNVALVVPDFDSLESWAKDNGIDTSDRQKMLDDPKVYKLFEQQLEEYSSDFKQFEKIRKFALIDEEFSTENGMLTPTLKLKRRIVMDKFGDVLQELYAK